MSDNIINFEARRRRKHVPIAAGEGPDGIPARYALPTPPPPPAPTMRGGVLIRPRVFARIDRALTQPITLIIAPKDTGKTMLVTTYLEQCEKTIRYIKLSRSPKLVREALESLTTETVAVCVIDNVGAIERLKNNEARKVSALLENVVTSNTVTRWILSGDSTGWLPIGSWLAHGKCDLAIDELDLRLTAEELEVLAAHYNVTMLNPGASQRILASTNGAIGHVVRTLSLSTRP